MKSLFIILKNTKNLIPYFFLIAIYFFFVNLEARKEKYNIRYGENENIDPIDKSNIDDKELKLKIPVVPYSQ